MNTWNTPTNVKILIGFLVMLSWGGLVLSGLTPVTDFVATLRQILEALGVYHIAVNNQGKP